MCTHRIKGKNYEYRHIRVGNKVTSVYVGSPKTNSSINSEVPIEVNQQTFNIIKGPKPSERVEVIDSIHNLNVAQLRKLAMESEKKREWKKAEELYDLAITKYPDLPGEGAKLDLLALQNRKKEMLNAQKYIK